MFGIIYCATNSVNGKQYVGQTTLGLSVRWLGHCKAVREGSTCALHCAIRKYGADAFVVEQLDFADSSEELNQKEAHYIDVLQTFIPGGYNLTTGGECYEISPETRRKQSWSHLGKIQPEEVRQKISIAHSGRIVSKETRLKLSETSFGRVYTAESRARMSNSRKRFCQNDCVKEEAVQRVLAAFSEIFGKRLSGNSGMEQGV